MAKFVFELEAVLTQRKAVERECMIALSEVERARLALEDRLRAMHAKVQDERLEWSQQLAGGSLIDLRGVRFQTTAALKTQAHAQQLVLQLAGIHKRIEQARGALFQAATRRKAVEMLRERRLEAWKVEQRRLDARTMDEVGTMRAAREAMEQQPIGLQRCGLPGRNP